MKSYVSPASECAQRITASGNGQYCSAPALSNVIHDSPRQAAQRRQIAAAFGPVNAISQLTSQEAVDLAKELFTGNVDEINSWPDIDRLKHCFTPDERAQIRNAANNNNQGTTVRAAWVERDAPQTFLPKSEAEVQALVDRVINQIVETLRTQGAQQLTEAILRQIPYVGLILNVRDAGNDLADLATAIQKSDAVGVATATGSLIGNLFGQQYVGYAATGVNAVRQTATNYAMKTSTFKSSIGKKD